MTTLFGSLAMLMVAALVVGLGGCATSDARVTFLDLPGPLTELGIDIENHIGSVRVEVTDKVDHICITESLLTAVFSTKDTRQSLQDRIMLDVERVSSTDGFETLRLRVVALEPLVMEEGVNLIVRLPRCSGIRVRNSAGDAVLVGVTGAIQVETSDGDIEVRCAEAVRSPVALITDSGNVNLQTPGGGVGQIELISNSGEAIFTSTLEPLHGMNTTRHWVRGTLGDGSNPITLRSDTGDVRMMVIVNPIEYTRWKKGNRRLATPEKYRDDEGG